VNPKKTYRQLTLLPAGSHSLANLTVLPGSAEARMMTVTSGRSLFGLYKNSNPNGWWVRMFLESSLPCSTRFLLTWKGQATPQRHSIFRLRLLEPTTEDIASSLWHTPSASDGEGGIMKMHKDKAGRYKLRGQVQPKNKDFWPTPTTQEIEHPEMELSKTGRRLTKDKNSSHSVGLADKVRLTPTAKNFWPTPRANKVEGYSSERFKPTLAQAVTGQKKPLGGQLNPTWVEWLMGFPIGWTDLERSETP